MIRSARQGICTEFWRRRGLEDVHLIDQEGDWRITLRGILGRKVVRIKDGCKGLRIVSIGWIWFANENRCAGSDWSDEGCESSATSSTSALKMRWHVSPKRWNFTYKSTQRHNLEVQYRHVHHHEYLRPNTDLLEVLLRDYLGK
jgi:hypothetical protein